MKHMNINIKSMILLVCIILSFCSCKNSSDNNNIVGSVNGENITAEELEYFSARLRTSVITEFVNKYKAVYDENFWNTEINGITPEKYLSDIAFDECVRAKLQLIMCKKYGIYDSISFDSLKAKAENFNDRQKENQSVGLTSISMDVFYTYYIENGVMELKNKLVSDGTLTNESEYDAYLDKLTDSADTVKYNFFTF